MSSAELHSDLTLIILAGGKSSRMGQDKGFLKLGDESFVKKLLEVAKRITPNILISVAKANEKSYKGFGFPLVVDEIEGKGPMAGITSALNNVKTQWFGLLTIDSPLVTKATLEELWCNRAGKEAVLYTGNHRIHPLVALYHSSTIEKWQEAMDENQLRVTALVESFDLKKIELAESRVKELKNINTPQEYQAVVAKE